MLRFLGLIAFLLILGIALIAITTGDFKLTSDLTCTFEDAAVSGLVTTITCDGGTQHSVIGIAQDFTPGKTYKITFVKFLAIYVSKTEIS